MALISDLVGKRVSVVTCDARHIIGIMNGSDQYINLSLTKCKELIYAEDGVTELDHKGIYIIRGDNVVLFGEVDPEIEKTLNYSEIKNKTLSPLIH